MFFKIFIVLVRAAQEPLRRPPQGEHGGGGAQLGQAQNLRHLQEGSVGQQGAQEARAGRPLEAEALHLPDMWLQELAEGKPQVVVVE